MAMNRVACELVRSGRLGQGPRSRAINYTGSRSVAGAALPRQAVPKGLDWNVWLNQAAWGEFNPEWMGWMRWRDFSGGEMTNWGAHGVDQIQWALGMDGTGPTEIKPLSEGGLQVAAMRLVVSVQRVGAQGITAEQLMASVQALPPLYRTAITNCHVQERHQGNCAPA